MQVGELNTNFNFLKMDLSSIVSNRHKMKSKNTLVGFDTVVKAVKDESTETLVRLFKSCVEACNNPNLRTDNVMHLALESYKALTYDLRHSSSKLMKLYCEIWDGPSRDRMQENEESEIQEIMTELKNPFKPFAGEFKTIVESSSFSYEPKMNREKTIFSFEKPFQFSEKYDSKGKEKMVSNKTHQNPEQHDPELKKVLEESKLTEAENELKRALEESILTEADRKLMEEYRITTDALLYLLKNDYMEDDVLIASDVLNASLSEMDVNLDDKDDLQGRIQKLLTQIGKNKSKIRILEKK